MTEPAEPKPQTKPQAKSQAKRQVALVRRSLQARVMVTVMVVSGIALAAVGIVLTEQVRSGVFNARVEDLLEEALRAAATAQDDFDASSVGSPITAETLARDTIRSIAMVGSSAKAVSLLPPDDAGPGAVSAIFTDNQLWDAASPQLRDAARTGGAQVWQSVALPVDADTTQPGVAVAQVVTLMATPYVLVMVYDLGPEQATMSLIARVLTVAAAAVVVIVVLVTWLVTHQAVRPVREAAGVAAKLADGALGERIPVRGHDEMATLAASFNEMAAAMQKHIGQLEDLSKLQRRFVSDVSHELRTPLATIRMAGDLIYGARDRFPPEVARSAELLANQLDRFDALLSDLLEISRFDAGAAHLDTERVDLRALVGWELDAVAPLAAENSVTVASRMPDRPARAEVDSRRISRIIRNLVVNAIEHADEGRVEVRLAVSEQAVAIVVEDNGVGLGEDQVERVFDRFWRADPARARSTGGTGLGLAIALEDANLHGGRLDAWGSPGVGAVFRLVVPRQLGGESGEAPLPLEPELEVAR
ncbi:MAG: HAMP domain-containing histidine kinase [Bifidobacteriaceae bacterium]|jgi:two-component system sensor histidine kinase MtrB|nr:HAMP domain-containing histidine kinase [Bifidobacteriaceae bacterium]